MQVIMHKMYNYAYYVLKYTYPNGIIHLRKEFERIAQAIQGDSRIYYLRREKL